MLRRCNRTVAIVIALGFLFLSRGMAQEATYLTIHGEGTASVLIPKDKKIAYIIDGGKANTGLGTAEMDGKPVLQALLDRGVKHLVIVCSHPHEDHMGGLVAMIENEKDFRRFNSYVFVDSGYNKAGGKESLFSIFEKTHGKQPDKTLYLPAERESKIEDVFKSDLSDTKLKDVFPGKLAGDDSVRVAMLEYEPHGKSDHDHALIVEHTLRNEEETIRIVNFDDAETKLIREWVKQRAADPAWKSQRIIGISPHHGSNNTDIKPLFAHGLKWAGFVFTVNPRNRYKHPGPENLLLCMKEVGVENVHFTGRDNVQITPAGITSLDSRAVHANYKLFIEPRLYALHRELATEWDALTEVIAAGQQITKERAEKAARKRASYQALLDIREKMLPNDDKGEPPPPLPPDPWGPRKPPSNGDLSDWITKRRPDGPTYPRIYDRDPRNPWKPSPGGASVGPFANRMKELERTVPTPRISVPLGLSPGRAIRLQSRSRFTPAIRMRPVFGGITIGNKAHSDLSVQKATIEVRDGRPAIILEVSTKKGRDTCRFEEMTMTDLWAAYYFVAPTAEMQEKYGVRPGEASLLGMSGKQADGWEFAIHPSIADTILARDGMRLDMLIASQPKELPKLTGFYTYQWYDEECLISAQDGILRVEAKTDPRDILLRVRLWGGIQPTWRQLRTPEQEIERREEDRVRKENLEDTESFRLAKIRSKTFRMVREELVKGNPDWLKPGEDRLVMQQRESARRYAEAVKADGLADSAPYKLEQLRADINRKLEEEVLAGRPKWVEAGESVFTARSREFARRYAAAVKEAGLTDAVEYRLRRLAEDVQKEVRLELEGEIANPHRNYVATVWKVSEAMRRMDRFARIVAVLNWLADKDKLPPLPLDVKPVLIDVPARFRYVDVLPKSPVP